MKHTLKYACRLLTVAAVLCVAVPQADAERLVIMHTNDTHSLIDPDDKDNMGGVGRRKVLVDSIREAEDHTLLIDAGDAVQGTLYFNLYGGKLETRLMNALGYDIRILGNHEFDNGVDSLAAVLRHADSDLISTNYDLSGSPLEPLFDKYEIRRVGDKRVGIIGINLEPKGMISDGNYDGVEYLDAIEAANAAAWWLKHVEGVDAVVAVTHIGYKSTPLPGDVDIARRSRDIDVIIGGHTHDLIRPDGGELASRVPNLDGREVLITQEGKNGKHLGVVTLDIDSTVSADYRIIPVDSHLDSRVDPGIIELIAPYRAGVDSLMQRRVATAAIELPQSSQELLNFCTDVVFDRGRQLDPGVELALLNKGGIRRGLPKGAVTEGQIITMMPFNNRVQVIDIKGADLLPALLQMARVGGSGVSKGVDVKFVPQTDDADARLESVTVNGQPLDPDRTYRVATIDYIAKGGDYMTTMTNHNLLATSPTELYKDILTYLKKHNKINPDSTVRMHQ